MVPSLWVVLLQNIRLGQKSQPDSGTLTYCILLTLFYIENDAEIFLVHYTWKVAENGFKMAFMLNKLAMINFCEIILEK